MDINIDVANNLKIEKYVFMKLCEVLSESYGLKRGKNVPIIESVAVFFYYIRPCIWEQNG